MVQYLGLWALIALSLNMWALLGVPRAGISRAGKAVWAAVLILLPGIGFLAWLFLRPLARG